MDEPGAINPEGRVVMQASRSVEGQVTVPAGFDPTRVVVRVQTLQVFSGPGHLDFEGFPRYEPFRGLDTALPEIFECRPSSEGRIHFGDVPVRGLLYLVTAGDGLGEAQWRNDNKTFDQPIQLTIGEESILTGRVVTPDRMPAVGMKVTARLSSFGRRQNFHLTSFRAVTDGNGKFPSAVCRQPSSFCRSRIRRSFGPFDPWRISSFNRTTTRSWS